MSTALTLTPYRRCTPERNRSIPTISAGFLGGRLGNVSAVDTSPRRSESGVLAARPGASVTGPSPPSPARRLRWGPVVMVRRRLRFESHLGSACSTRGGIYWPRVVRTARRPHLPKVPPHPPPVAPHPRAVHPDDAGNHHSDQGTSPAGRISSSPIWQTHTQAVS